MTKTGLLAELDIILDEPKTAILATSDENGQPRMRWMTPTILKDRSEVLYAVTAQGFEKAKHLEKNPNVEWMVQPPSLETIITLRGKLNVVDNASLKSEVLEAIGKRLTAFWKLNENQANMVVLETVIEEAVLYKPMIGVKSRVKFN